ncbi:MAG: PDDEXK nuclease domain-containing protein [Propionibacteriaceae bacterium]|jgi:predicted nuclease of restriction endonuclease-like (RecB) superfamily|nr:PDDEXK nuclease domain-containing protein [Propionibacteriaceae bacterium]
MLEEGSLMLINNPEYLAVVDEIKARIAAARQRAMVAANTELVMLYWDVGHLINRHREWGNAFVPNLARDIRGSNPRLRGFSARNLASMQKLAEAYPDLQVLQTLSAKLTWSHMILLIEKAKDPIERAWYAEQSGSQSWSVRRLESALLDRTYHRQILAPKTTNFREQLGSPQANLAQDVLKDPYIFDFIDYRNGMVEREIEDELVGNIARLLIELGAGFAFVGEQYRVEIEGREYAIDLLFYHLKLRCYVVIELKAGDFKPEYAGKLNFYVSAVDDLIASDRDEPTIGILLCKSKAGLVAEYAFRGITSPIGVSEYRLFDKLPAEYEDLIPTAEDIEARIGLSLPGDDI